MILTYLIGVVTGQVITFVLYALGRGHGRHHGPPMPLNESQVAEAVKRGLL